MTKKLEDLLNIADTDKTDTPDKKAETAITEQSDTFRDIAEFDKIANALPVSYTHLTLPTKRIV